MKTNESKCNTAAAAAKVEVIKLGQDVHAMQITVVVQLDGTTPQPAQRIAVEKYLGWVSTLIKRHPGAEVVSCYEAGPCGYPFPEEHDDDSVPERQEEDGGPERCNLGIGD